MATEKWYTAQIFCFHNPNVIEENFPGDHVHMTITGVYESKPDEQAVIKNSKERGNESAIIVYQVGTKELLLNYNKSQFDHANLPFAKEVEKRSKRGLGTKEGIAIEAIQMGSKE